jgi:transcriptional regulator with XRE-family HTH domain
MSDDFAITPGQSRAGRALLGISRAELAKLARVSAATLADFEGETKKREHHARTIEAVRDALQAAGVEFFDGGVRPSAEGAALK